ncbi:MAG TPA: patatin family protein [Lachnospiraceae bacterium]|nr:patatin family protein [uncultured Lachnoclostridium sp.]HAU87664.1 patatin family protein [Lachnospiraceae bacterium]
MKTGLVLEGGSCKGIFTAGVLDYWMEQNLYFPYVVSVSAGTCNALNYIANQIGRTKQCMIPDKENRYYGMKRLIKTGHILDLDRVFHEYAYNQFPYDGKTYFQSKVKNEIVVTNCNTGEAEYLTEQKDLDRLFLKGKASCSLPLLANMVEIDGQKYLDGGMADSIPVIRAMEEEKCDRAVVIMTHNKGYVPSVSKQLRRLYSRKYHKYPEFLQAVLNRPEMYQKELDALEKYEKEGRVLVIRPEQPAVKRMERNNEKLEHFFEHGYQVGKDTFENVMKFINEDS